MSKPSFIYVTYIASTPEKVWAAITQGAFTKQYLFGRDIQSDWQEGSQVNYYRPNGELDVYGTVLHSDPFHLLSYTWAVPGDTTQREMDSKVTFEIHPMDSSTVKLTLRHENLEPSDMVAEGDTFYGLNNGWPAILSNLKSLLETGRTLPPIFAD